jgi:MFS family permease
VFGLAIALQKNGVIGADFSLVLMYISRTLSGLFSGATIAVAMAYMADITSDDERTKGMGLIGMAIGLGFIFGPGIGGLLTIGGSYSLPFFVSAALSFLTMLFAIAYVRESLTLELREKAKAARTQKVSRWSAFQGPSRFLFIIAFLATFILAGLEGTLQLFQMEKIGVTPAQMGAMFLLSGIAGALMQGVFIQRYVKKGDEVRYMIIGFILSGIAFVLLLFTRNLVEASIYLCLFGIGNSLIRPCVTSLITQKSNVAYGISTGLSASFDSLGRVIGPLFAGMLFVIDINLPFMIGAMFSLLAVFVIYAYARADKIYLRN